MALKKNKMSRYTALVIIMLVIYIAILSKLAVLQVVKHDDYKDRANNRSVRQIPEQAPRGKILDSTGAILADSRQSYTVEYIETTDSEKEFFDTMTKVFKMLDDLGEGQKDDFKLKIGSDKKFYIEYTSSDPASIKKQDLRFKKDRGLDSDLSKELEYFKKKKGDLSEEDQLKLEDEMLKVTPEEMFYRLVKQYDLYKLINPNPTDEEVKAYKKKDAKKITEELLQKYSLEQLRRYMLVKDTVKMQSFSGFKPVTIASNIKDESAFIFMQKLNDLPGIDVRLQPIRFYPYGNLASSVIGYLSSINGDQKDRYEERGYDITTDTIGISGIEAAYEDRLKGSKGGTTVKVNKVGRKTEELFRLDPYPGDNIQLTLDKNLQYTAQRALKETLENLQKQKFIDGGKTAVGNANRGAVVATDVNTGKVLALASFPDFDPNIFTIPGKLTPELSKQYFNPDFDAFAKDYINKTSSSKTVEQLFPKDSNGARRDSFDVYPKPFFNYATQGTVPTGSTFKTVTATAGLEEGLITPGEKVLDQGIFNKYPEFKNYQGKCDIYERSHGSHGYVDMAEAFRVSCNYYFYEVAYRLYKKDGLDKLAQYAWRLGLGSDPNSKGKVGSGIEIAENTDGQVYNLKSYTETVAFGAKFEVVEALEVGYYKFAPERGKKHTPFNIAYDKNDDEALDKAKSEVKDYIINKIKAQRKDNKNDEFNEITKELKVKFENLISKYNKEEQKKYSKSDVENASYNMARYIVFDKSGDITSPGNLTNASIGLGMNNFTPLQMTNAVATIINGGKRYKVHLVDKILNPDNKVVEEIKPVVVDDLKLKTSTVNAIKEGMRRVNQSGTFKDFPISSGGKTGTTPYRPDQREIGRSAYGVYVAFAPLEKPEIAVTVVLYDVGHGSSSGPVAKAVLETYFRDKIKAEFPGYKSSSTSYSLDPKVEEVNTGK